MVLIVVQEEEKQRARDSEEIVRKNKGKE